MSKQFERIFTSSPNRMFCKLNFTCEDRETFELNKEGMAWAARFLRDFYEGKRLLCRSVGEDVIRTLIALKKTASPDKRIGIDECIKQFSNAFQPALLILEPEERTLGIKYELVDDDGVALIITKPYEVFVVYSPGQAKTTLREDSITDDQSDAAIKELVWYLDNQHEVKASMARLWKAGVLDPRTH